MRAGSSGWYYLITQHPGVAVPPGPLKELHFFDEFWHGGFDQAQIDRYHRFFPRPEGALVGEWTPRYMYDLWTPRVLSQAAPEAKLLAILRDPLTRYRSHLSLHLGRVGQPTSGGCAAAADALARSLYAPQLRRVLRRFDRDQLLVLQLERCQADPLGELRRTYHARRINAGQVGFTLPAELERELIDAFDEQLPSLLEIAPDLDLDLWPSARSSSARRS
jgi:hypothetical protein